MPTSRKKPNRVPRQAPAADDLRYSLDGKSLLAVYDQELRRFVRYVGPLGVVAAAYGVAQATQIVPAVMQAEALAVAGVCGSACLALHTFVRLKCIKK